MRSLFKWLSRDVTLNTFQYAVIVLITVQVYRFCRIDTQLINEVRRLQQSQDSHHKELNHLKHAGNAKDTSNSTPPKDPMSADVLP